MHPCSWTPQALSASELLHVLSPASPSGLTFRNISQRGHLCLFDIISIPCTPHLSPVPSSNHNLKSSIVCVPPRNVHPWAAGTLSVSSTFMSPLPATGQEHGEGASPRVGIPGHRLETGFLVLERMFATLHRENVCASPIRVGARPYWDLAVVD